MHLKGRPTNTPPFAPSIWLLLSRRHYSSALINPVSDTRQPGAGPTPRNMLKLLKQPILNSLSRPTLRHPSLSTKSMIKAFARAFPSPYFCLPTNLHASSCHPPCCAMPPTSRELRANISPAWQSLLCRSPHLILFNHHTWLKQIMGTL